MQLLRPRQSLFACTVFALVILFVSAIAGPSHAQSATQMPAIEAGAQTRGGVTESAAVIIVSNLADNGRGSLRAAVEAEGPRIVVFETAGVIWLRSDLEISDPYITIAGQTAPSPGITIRGAGLSVQTHNVVIQHISIRPGSSRDPEVNRNRDALSISSCADCRQPTQDVRVENVSASWAVDEVIGLWGATLNRVTIRNSIIAEALHEAGHPKGGHSMGLLIGARVQSVLVAGNLFASNMRRNPVISAGASAMVANNLIYNPGRAAIHFYPGAQIRASVIGNVLVDGPSTKSSMKMLEVPGSFSIRSADALIYVNDNYRLRDTAFIPENAHDGFSVITYPIVRSGSWQIGQAHTVRQRTIGSAGSRPQDRNVFDRQLLREFKEGKGTILNRAPVDGSPYANSEHQQKLDLPEAPFSRVASTNDLRRIEAWLCERHLAVGGPQTPECQWDITLYRKILTQ